MENIRQTSRLVKQILTENPQTRNSDSFLYLKVLERQADQKGMAIHSVHLSDFLLNSAEWGFAPFETVRRTRQKIQRECPELASAEKVAQMRLVNEAAFREYARGDL